VQLRLRRNRQAAQGSTECCGCCKCQCFQSVSLATRCLFRTIRGCSVRGCSARMAWPDPSLTPRLRNKKGSVLPDV
jgi:hypothetical protein